MKILKGDTVKIIAGKDKGKTGIVLETLAEKNQVVVDQVNVVNRHQKNRRSRSQGQIISKNLPIDVSNVSLLKDDKPVRVGYTFTGEGKNRKKVRVAKGSGDTI